MRELSSILGLPSQAAFWIPSINCLTAGTLYVYQLLVLTRPQTLKVRFSFLLVGINIKESLSFVQLSSFKNMYRSTSPFYITHAIVFLLSISNPIYLSMIVFRNKCYCGLNKTATYYYQFRRLLLYNISDRWKHHLKNGCTIVGSFYHMEITMACSCDDKLPPKTLKRRSGTWGEWIEAVRGGEEASCNFDHASLITEAVLLGNIAIRFDKTLQWDSGQMKSVNNNAANNYIRPNYRSGWSL